MLDRLSNQAHIIDLLILVLFTTAFMNLGIHHPSIDYPYPSGYGTAIGGAS